MQSFQSSPLIYPDVIANNAKFFRDKPAVICQGEQLSWSEYDRTTNKAANALLKNGLQKGDRVCLVMQSSIDMFVMIWAIIKAGGVVVPLNTMLAPQALASMIENSGARLIFSDEVSHHVLDDVRSQLRDIPQHGYFMFGPDRATWRSATAEIEEASDADPRVDILPEDSMSIIYTSGTTAAPKGIEHTHSARLIYPLGYGPGLRIDRYAIALCATPLYANGTWITMLPTVYAGGTTVLLKKFDADAFFGAVQQHKCTHVFLVPTQFIGLLNSTAIDTYDHSSLRVLLSSGQALPTKLFEEIGRKFPHADRFEAYGQSEGYLTLCTPEDYARGKFGSGGLPIYGGDTCIIDEHGKIVPPHQTGEICGWSPGLLKGYFRDPKRTDEAIWIGPRGRTYIRTGDVGHIDEDGYVYVSDRLKDMIKSGGINIFGSDVEEVFMRHPEVRECAAIGIPHSKWGETPLLLAIMKAGSTIGEDELMQWGNGQLGKWQRVSRVEFRDDFPRATYNKVLKRALREPYWEGQQRKI